jgi:hypothetical protein
MEAALFAHKIFMETLMIDKIKDKEWYRFI